MAAVSTDAGIASVEKELGHEGARSIWTMQECIDITSYDPVHTCITEMVYDFKENNCRFVLQWRDGDDESEPDVLVWKAPYKQNMKILQHGKTAIIKREHGGENRLWMRLHSKGETLPADTASCSYISVLRPEC
jgi:hypothetical protein